MRIHNIKVEKRGKKFCLFDNGHRAGNRLFKGNDTGSVWPFTSDNWTEYTKKSEAETAARDLQTYLDKREEQLEHSA